MQQRIARTLLYLARPIINQHTARTNAAAGIAILRRRRLDQEHVDEYLKGRLLTFPLGATNQAERGEYEAEHVL